MASNNDARRRGLGGMVMNTADRARQPLPRQPDDYTAAPGPVDIDPDGVPAPFPKGRPYDTGGVNPKLLFQRPGFPIDPGGVPPPGKGAPIDGGGVPNPFPKPAGIPYDEGGVSPKRPWWMNRMGY
jgi:hypothetical protein